MTEIRASRPEEIPQQKELWRLAFGDGEEYISYFYSQCYQPENMLVLLEDGKLRTMLALLPMTLRFEQGEQASALYVYALATDPAARKKGFGRQLLHYVDFYLRERGIDCLTVVPAEPSLHKFFSTVDFDECFDTRMVELLGSTLDKPQNGAKISPVQPEQYNQIRHRLLKGTRHVEYADTLIAYQQGLSRMEHADLYQLEAGGAVGVAAVEYLDEESVVVKELLMAEDMQVQAVACLAAQLPAVRYHVRTPAFWSGLPGGYLQPFAMVKWYSKEKESAWGQKTDAYMGLGFD